ncbi:hypothetical protein BJF79_30250 [Actinomadura sp. CNU-125]|uniref:NTP transferase domain-containing protein n=1 Tax=Actinomadura sp. CNU-125 TaxID=1904961 RepID=UPI000966545C|nr:NTP transferase domain-containing protein [Actinomadura sp. CNU-125]OLT37074.1 hypothetical protein BJF79_30250 [Actinomadura sp. CNU-125]
MSRPRSTRTVLFCRPHPPNAPGPLTDVCGRPMAAHALSGTDCDEVLVVGADEETAARLRDLDGRCEPWRGRTAGALRSADRAIVLMLRADAPLLTAESVERLLAPLREGRYAAARLGAAWAFAGDVLDSVLDDPALDDHALDDPALGDPGEVPAAVAKLLEASGVPVAAPEPEPGDGLTVTGQPELAAARRAMRDRIVRLRMSEGVTVLDPETTWIGADVVVRPGATLLRNTELTGGTVVESGCTIGPDCTLIGTTVGAGTRIRSSTCENVAIGADNDVGPYTYLRGGTRSGRGVIMGSFAHIKATVIGDDSKVPHFAYLGDAEIGARCNLSGFTGTVNHDGVRAHRTTIGDDVMIGAGTAMVAPISIGGGAYTAAGSLLTKDVPPGALAMTRVRQRHIEDWVESTMPDSPAARTVRGLRVGE